MPTKTHADEGANVIASREAIDIAIVYHSGYGHTARQARAVAQGVEEQVGTSATMMTVEEAPTRWAALNASDAIIFGCPTYVGAGSAAFKVFQEASSNAVMSQGYRWKNKLAAGFTNSGSLAGDKLATLVQMSLFAAQHGMIWVGLDLPPSDCASTPSLDRRNRMGFWLGAAAQSNVDEGPDTAPPEADIATAAHLGRRVAALALQMARGQVA